MTNGTGKLDPYARTIYKFAASVGINTAGKDPIQVLSDWAERDRNLLREREHIRARAEEMGMLRTQGRREGKE